MRTIKPLPSKAKLIELIEAAGSGSMSYFGYPELKNGLYLQQDSEEFASFVHYVASKLPPATLSLDLGTASGGQTKFLRDYYSCDKTIILDIGLHPNFKEWARIKPTVNSDIILELIDDSHSPTVAAKLEQFAGQIDFAFVDGDHSYRGLKKDIFLVRELLRVGGYLILHDTLAVPDCKRVYDELLASPLFGLIRNFDFRFGISIWQLKGELKSNEINRRFGIGKI